MSSMHTDERDTANFRFISKTAAISTLVTGSLVLVLSIFLWSVRLAGQRTGWHHFELSVALFVLSNILILSVFVWRSAASLVRQEMKRKQVQEILRESEEKFRVIAQTANDAIVLANRQGKIIYFNQAAEQMFGYTGVEAQNQPLTILMPERYRDAHQKGLSHYLATRETRVIGKTLELAGQRKDGTEFPLEISIASWETSDNIFFTAIIRDITERKLLEEKQLRLSEELARSKAELKQLELFAFVTSHDLQEPLHKITAFSDLLAIHAGSHLSAKAQETLNSIQDAASRLSQMIEQLRQLSRILTQASPFVRLDLKQLVREALEELKETVDATKAKVEIENLPAARGDAFQIKLVFKNLLENALKFCAKNCAPQILISSGKQEPNFVEISVEDRGIGFEEKYAEQIFVPFQRLNAKHEYSGSGIGLAICKNIIVRHGGRITVESRPGKGSVFQFTLPSVPE